MVRIQKILCPVDFFPASERAAKYAITLAKKYKAGLILLHVVPPMIPYPYEVPVNSAELVGAMRKHARVELEKLAARAAANGVKAEVIVRTGEVDPCVRAIVEARKADLIVMGTHGRHGIEKFFIGSVTEGMLRRAPVPLLTIGSTKSNVSPAKIRHILVITDFSAGTADALSYAFSLAQAFETPKVTLLHVLNDVDADISGRYRDQLIRSIHNELQNLVAGDVPKGCEVKTRVETGLPIRRILPILKNDGIDLLVMNVHSKTLVDRLMVGSTAERVVRGAVTPVLVIPPLAAPKRRRRVSRKAA